MAILVLIAVVTAMSLSAAPAAAAEGLSMEATGLLGGHVRPGAWMAIEVHLTNAGPPVTGELRLTGGSTGRTRFGVAVDMPTGSEKRYVIYAQPPNFGTDVEVALVSGTTAIDSTKVAYQLHPTNQALIGVVAEQPARIVNGIDLPVGQNMPAPAIVGLTPETLPDRVEGWAPLDRLVWQDVDTARLTPAQVGALKGWVASGGRLVIVGGTAGPGLFSALPDEMLPYRPEATVDVVMDSLVGLLGSAPDEAPILPALAGTLVRGRALATSGDRAVAAETAYGSGNVTIVGIDPTVPLVAGTGSASALWQRLLPARQNAGFSIADDSQILNAVANVPTLALPPIGGLLLLLVGYIVLIGPVNYLVLRRLDKREWAWVTMPILIGVFAVGAFAYGAYLRGSDILLNEVAIVRGSPGTSEGIAQAYMGIFSPGRATYDVEVPGGALLSAPVNADFFGNPDGSASVIDILQGDPSSVRNLAVAIGGFRVVRAESRVVAPALDVSLALRDGQLSGVVRNLSDRSVADAAIVLGSTVAKLGDLAPGASVALSPTSITTATCCQPLSDRLVGQLFSGIGGPSEASQRQAIRHYVADQLTWDPNFGTNWSLPTDGPVVLGWGTEPLLPVEIDGLTARRTANVLYYVPATMTISGTTRFGGDLMRSSIVNSDAPFFSKDPWSIGFGRGTMTLSYRPIGFEGTMTPRRLLLAPNFGVDVPLAAKGELVAAIGPAIEQDAPPCANPPCAEPTPEPEPAEQPPDQVPQNFDGLPEVELYDVTTSTWMAFPHLSGRLYEIEDGARYIDPASGQVLIRFRNDISDSVGFSFALEVEADVR